MLRRFQPSDEPPATSGRQDPPLAPVRAVNLPFPTLDLVKSQIRRLHVNDGARMLPHNLASLAYLAALAAALCTWQWGWWPITVLLWAIAAHLGHMKLIALHEASHGTLNPRRWRNELQGTLLAAITLVPLSVYRYVHCRHHAYLGTPRDLELWPYVEPAAPRGWRILSAVAELTVGFFYTPIIFLRGVLAGKDIPRRQRLRMAAEYAGTIALWTALLTVVAWRGWWTQLAVGYLVPALLSGNLQSLRKFTEHMGLTGGSILELTRTVVDPSLAGKAFSESMLHVDHHGTHHRYAKVPHYNLPIATPLVYEGRTSELPLFTSYAAAMLDMLRSLGDPRIGRQWLPGQAAAPQSPVEARRVRAA